MTASPAPFLGWLLLSATLLSLLSSFGSPLPSWLPGALLWCAGAAFFPLLNRLQRIQALCMLVIGGAAFGIAACYRPTDNALFLKALAGNHSLIAMLASVTFLRLVTHLKGGQKTQPRGRNAIVQTLLGVHLFGAVINMSALFIMGDQLARKDRLNRLQACTLSRGFSLAAHWSPFFVAMGVALTQAPGSHLITLSLVGLIPAAAGLLIAYRTLANQPGSVHMRGYPIRLDALRLPLLLAIAVLVFRQWLPETSVIALVSALALATSLGAIILNKSHALTKTEQHITQQLPKMGGEVVLFLSAAVLSSGISAMAQAGDLKLATMELNAPLAILLLNGMVALAVLGIHPLISISTVSGLLPNVPDPNLLAMIFLMSWALGVAASPLSGMHLAMQGRYGIPSHRFMRWNGRFVLLMLAVDSLVLAAYDYLG